MQPGKTWLVHVFKRGIRKWEIALASIFLSITKVIPGAFRTHVTNLLPCRLEAGVGACWATGRGGNRTESLGVQNTLPKCRLRTEHHATAQADVKKHMTGVLCFWTHLEPKRNCLLLVSTGMEIGKQGPCLICQNTEYIKALRCCFLFIPQEIRFQAGGEGKERERSWAEAEMFWLCWGTLSTVTLSLLNYSLLKFRLGNLG